MEHNVVGLIMQQPELVRAGIRLRQFGQNMIEQLGGRKIHPAGGVRETLSEAHHVKLRSRLPKAFATAQIALVLFKNCLDAHDEEFENFGNFNSLFMGLVSKTNAQGEHYDGWLCIVRNWPIGPTRTHRITGVQPSSKAYKEATYFEATEAAMNAQITRKNFDQFSDMSSSEGGLCLSILISTDEHAATPKQAAIALKNSLHKAEQRLIEAGRSVEEIHHYITPIQALADSGQLWAERAPGLAIFSNGHENNVFFYRLPFHVHEIVIVASHFYFKPLLAALHGMPRFYVLALSLNSVRLFCFNEHVREIVRLPGVPRSIEDLPTHEDLDTQRHSHSFTHNNAHGRGLMHSHGPGDINYAARQAHYFQHVARAVDELLRSESAPLVLAGVQRDTDYFREASKYAHTVAGAITGSPLLRSIEDLRTEAAQLLDAESWAETARALQRYKKINNTPRVTRLTKEIVRAAHEGRIDTLFVAQDIDKWGSFDPTSYEVRMHSLPQPGDLSLLNLAAEFTLHHHGDVFLLPRARVPRNSPMAAILRG